MKVTARIVLICLSIISTEPTPDSNCKKYPLLVNQSLEFNQLAGIWYGIKVTPTPGIEDSMECTYEIYFEDLDATKDKFKCLYGYTNGYGKVNHIFSTLFKYYPNSTEIEPEITFQGLINIEATLIGKGKSWLLWNYCFTFPPFPPVDSFLIVSRNPVMDPKTEEPLIQYITNALKITPEKIKAIRQTDCN